MIKKIILGFLLILLGTLETYSQVVSAVPAFPAASDSVTITFDAAKGDAGLKDFTGDVYAHTGVITVNSTSSLDWKYVKADWNVNIPACKMTYLGNNLWQLKITPSIRAYYGVPSGEKILKLAFVFRSADGSKTGRNTDGSDIFYNVYQAGITSVQITLPANKPDIVDLNDTVVVQGNSANADSTYLLLDNQVLVADTTSSFSYKIVARQYGRHWIIAKAVKGSTTVYDSVYYYVNRAPVVAALPDGVRDGINYINDSTVTLSLYAPHKKYIFAIGDFSNWEVGDKWAMNITPDSNRFWIKITGLTPKKEYIFQYLIDGTIRIGDPYADKVSDPWNDQYISPKTYPNLIKYPKGKTTGIATVLQTGQTPYPWKVTGFKAPKPENLVVYELLVRDFTKGHTFDDIIDTLGYLKRLGINAIELMPVSEFEGNSSWGYNPNYYFAPDKYYGPKNTFKAFVDSSHAKGIAVIMDMVLNHAYGTNPFVMMYWNSAKNQPAADNPWFNQTSPNPEYHWGYDFNHESSATKRFVDSVNHYWISQYKVDGFRFDFTKGFTNTPGNGNAYDQSRINILERMAHHIWSYKSNAYVILEHFTANSEEKVLTDYGMSVWGNLNNNYNQATMGYVNNSDFSWISYEKRGFTNPAGVMGYMESHDEERLMYKNEQFGDSSGTYNIRNIPTALKRMELAGAFFFAIPGPKMIWMFGELGYDYSIDYNGRVGEKPIRWDYYQDMNRKHLYGVWSALIHLKETQSVFQTKNYNLDVSGAEKQIHLTDTSMDVTVLGNFNVTQQSITPNFQKTGWWYNYFSGDSINVTNTNAAITLTPGEYRLYTTKRLTRPDFILGVPQNTQNAIGENLSIYPNPAISAIDVKWNMNRPSTGEISLFDLTGRKVRVFYKGSFKRGVNRLHFSLDGLNRGLYFMVVDAGNIKQVKKLMVQ
ncbi:MAG: hypothetical protein IEMM0006_0186 [bacterium]|nr:MAG: hypothetical protein IEMM0006_0186 [bacterium]